MSAKSPQDVRRNRFPSHTRSMLGTMANAAGELNQELSTEEAQAFLEDQTRRYLDMSLAELYQRAEAGTLPDDPVVTHLVLLSGAHPGAC